MKAENPTYDIVFLVDDDPIMNLVHRKLIDKTGITKEIRTFTDPTAALKHLFGKLAPLEHNLNVLILLDINMPEMSGFEFLDSASLFPSNGNKLDILMVTSSISYGDMQRGLKNDLVTCYLNKPLMETEILNFVQKRSLLYA